MSLIKFFHELIKYFCLFFLSLTQSFNYLNYNPFIIIYLRETKSLDLNNNIFLFLYFIIYEIAKYFSIGITARLNYLIGDHYYYSLSICILSVVNLIFSFFSFSFYNIYILIVHRIFISLFNNITSNIDLPLTLFYSKKQFIFKKRNYTFIQKLTNFIFFVCFLLFFIYFKKFYIFCFLLSVMNLLSFIISLIIVSCHKDNIYNQFVPSLSEKENESNVRTSQKGKTENRNNEIVVEGENINISMSNNINNISTGINNMDNLIKDNKNKMNNNLIYNELVKNDNKSLDISNKNKLSNNSTFFRGIIFPPSFKLNNQYKNLFQKNTKKILISLIIVLILSKCLNFFSLYMLLFKVNEINILTFVDSNNYELIFSKFSSFLNINSIEEEYIFLFACYFFLNIFQYFINLSYTSIAFKKKIINYIFYYLSLIIILVSSLFFTHYYGQKFINTKMSLNIIRKRIIIFFGLNLITNECTLIMSVFFNIIGKKKGFSEKLLKDIKTSSTFLASLIIIIIQSINISIKEKITNGFLIYYIIFCSFIIIMFLISIFLFNY